MVRSARLGALEESRVEFLVVLYAGGGHEEKCVERPYGVETEGVVGWRDAGRDIFQDRLKVWVRLDRSPRIERCRIAIAVTRVGGFQIIDLVQ